MAGGGCSSGGGTFDPWADAAAAAAAKGKSGGVSGHTTNGGCEGSDGPNQWASYQPGTGNDGVSHSNVNERMRHRDYDRGNNGFGGNRRGGSQRRDVNPYYMKKLERIQWKGLDLPAIQKDFAIMHPRTEQLSTRECDGIRAKHSIHVFDDMGGEGHDLPKPVLSFEEVPFPDWIVDVLRQKGFKEPRSIQVQAWPAILKGRDLIGIAETGSGKTIAYVPPMLVHLLAQPELQPGEGPVAIILVPSRELCIQVHSEIEAFISTANKGIRSKAVHGGTDIEGQALAFVDRCDIVVSTPGRLIHLLNAKKTNLRRATFLVLDEADELLDQGFEEQVKLIVSQVRPDRQVCLFSATWPPKIEMLSKEVTEKPITINVGCVKLSACKDIQQKVMLVGALRHPHKGDCVFKDRSKTDILLHTLIEIKDKLERTRALIFCNNVDTVPKVVNYLKSNGFPCEGCSGKCLQREREDVIKRFQDDNGNLRILVCTKLLGRGHDFKDLNYVFNFDMPSRIVEYIHRIGRTGRAGKQGYSVTLLEETDLGYARDLIDVLEATVQEVPTWLRDARKKRGVFSALWRSNCFHGSSGGDGMAVSGNVTHSNGMAYQAAAHTRSTAESHKWNGRGVGRRHIFLEQCNGRGPARAPAAFVAV
eukprot:CAMPEP_0172682008 /NCGR_PEP_ID=MMETSP1074-20121228/17863_1 /TAXON_ID=2916 /ORGANISM="Ceratium fusus, Strain PA161109" /LENGTH=645 /DNA_ID=CAMNT_0013500611 /DNA_START=44 /DNA_END=1978 /DNA_ORIENTATION=-